MRNETCQIFICSFTLLVGVDFGLYNPNITVNSDHRRIIILKEAPRLNENSHGLPNVSRRIQHSNQRIIRSLMPNEYLVWCIKFKCIVINTWKKLLERVQNIAVTRQPCNFLSSQLNDIFFICTKLSITSNLLWHNCQGITYLNT